MNMNIRIQIQFPVPRESHGNTIPMGTPIPMHTSNRDQQRFTISEVAADWHEPTVPQRIMWPYIDQDNGQLDQLADTRLHRSATLYMPSSRSLNRVLVWFWCQAGICD